MDKKDKNNKKDKDKVIEVKDGDLFSAICEALRKSVKSK